MRLVIFTLLFFKVRRYNSKTYILGCMCAYVYQVFIFPLPLDSVLDAINP